MYRILKANKDTYITNKYIAGKRCTTSNVGQAATIDLFKLYDETTIISASTKLTGVVELTRGLLQFDYEPLQQITASFLNINDSSFKAYLSLKDVYGGQTTPSNFSIRLIPLAQDWDEGRGFDVVAFRDLDTANFLTASVVTGTPNVWFLSGAAESGSLGDPNIDIIVSGNLGTGLQDLTVTQQFARGDENLYMDVTTLVSAAIAGDLPNYGWRLSFIDAQEQDNVTRFVKRFGTRQANNADLHPQLVIKYNDQLRDDMGQTLFNVSQSLFTFNRINGGYQNYFSGSTEITGANSLLLNLYGAKYLTYYTSSFSLSHSASINHLTRSLYSITQSFLGSQYLIGSLPQTGIYYADVNFNTVDNTVLKDFLTGSTPQEFTYAWTSLDGTLTYAAGKTLYKLPQGSISNVEEKNWVVNITNLKQEYKGTEQARLRIFALDYNTEQTASRVPLQPKSVILDNLKWRLINAYSRKVIIPFDNVATLCSYDAEGMYFDLWMGDFAQGEVYEIELMITYGGKDYLISNAGFRFKVTP
jgi:hypothetical protein